MKKYLICAALMCCGLARAFDGAPTFVLRSGGVEHTLTISAWKQDRKGVPSFDYVYEQRAGSCHFRLSGHAVAGFDEQGGKVELEVFNPESEDGRELPQILMFYDGAVSMTLPLKGAPRQAGFRDALTAAQRNQTCGAHQPKLALSFKR